MLADYQAGFQARLEGKKLPTCPYKSGKRRRGWVTGWLAANDWRDPNGRGIDRLNELFGDWSGWPLTPAASLDIAYFVGKEKCDEPT